MCGAVEAKFKWCCCYCCYYYYDSQAAEIHSTLVESVVAVGLGFFKEMLLILRLLFLNPGFTRLNLAMVHMVETVGYACGPYGKSLSATLFLLLLQSFAVSNDHCGRSIGKRQRFGRPSGGSVMQLREIWVSNKPGLCFI